MRKIVSSFFLSIVISFSSAQPGIAFEDLSLDQALEKSKMENKLIFVNVYTDWCEPCSAMEEYVFSDQEVGEFCNDTFINIRMDAEVSPGKELADIYQAFAFPSYLFINWKGELVHKGCGGMASDEFIGLARQSLDPGGRLLDYQLAYEKNKKNPEYLAEFSLMLNDACLDSSPFVRAFFEELPREEWVEEPGWTVINFNVADPYNEQFQYLLQNREAFISRYGKDTVDEKIFSVFYGQFADIYNGEDLTLFATQALSSLVENTSFQRKEELRAMVDLFYAEQVEDWKLYGKSAVKVVTDQEITDPEQLNEFAWKFYVYVEDKEQLTEAKRWMEEILKEYVDATFMDTYASLLFKLGDTKAAVKWEKLALESAELAGEDPEHYQLQLELFKQK